MLNELDLPGDVGCGVGHANLQDQRLSTLQERLLFLGGRGSIGLRRGLPPCKWLEVHSLKAKE